MIVAIAAGPSDTPTSRKRMGRLYGLGRMGAAAVLLACSGPACAQSIRLPPTERIETSEILHGAAVPDFYRWLEDTKSPRTLAWAAEQDRATEAFAGRDVAARQARIRAYSNVVSTRELETAGGRTFFMRGWAGSPYQALFVGDPNGEARRLDGPAVSLDQPPATATETVTSAWPSVDGTRVLALTAPQGNNASELRLIDVETGQVLARHTGVHRSLSNATWIPGSNAYAYVAHGLSGQPSHTRVVLVRDGVEKTIFAPPPAEDGRWPLLAVSTGAAHGRLFVEAAVGTSGVVDLYALPLAGGAPMRLNPGPGAWRFLGARGDSVWAYTTAGAPNGSIVRLDPTASGVSVATVIPEDRSPIALGSSVGGDAMGMFGDRIALMYRVEASPVIRIFDLQGRLQSDHAVPASGSVWGGFRGDPDKAEMFYSFLGASEPASIYRADLHEGQHELVTAARALVTPEDIVARRVYVTASDGARIPVLIAHRRGLDLSRPRPAIMYGYGAFGWASFLFYQPEVVDWVMHDDGIFVMTGVRGGAELGPAWQDAGRRRNRQRAIDDFHQIAEYLVAQRITTARQLVANGSSIAGGLVGAALNQRPELFGAGLIDFPVLDLLHYDQWGHARTWTDELGSLANPEDFAVLRRLSPYHNIPSDRCLPPTMVRIGPNDATVFPLHGYKYIAERQTRSNCPPAYLDVMDGAGHNHGSTPDEVAHNHAVALEFLRRVLPDSAP